MNGTRPTTGFATSADGTAVGYRRFGSGPGCVLLHGALQASQNLTELAVALADRFTVYVPDRRGRGLTDSPGDDDIDTHVADVAAVLAQGEVRNIFGLSSGAILALHTALAVPGLAKVAVYEPPLSIDFPPSWLPRYRAEVDRNDLASAFVTVLKGTRAAPLFNVLPRWAATQLVRAMLTGEARRATEGTVPLRDLIPTMRFEPHPGATTTYADIAADVLLLGGTRSPRYLREALDDLETGLPGSRRIRFPGLDHLGPDNRGKPAVIATALASFFSGDVTGRAGW